jgi:hypothetical protein
MILRYEKTKQRVSEAGGTRLEKLADIRDFVFEQFREKRNHRLVIHDEDLRRWALQYNRSLTHPLSDFKAKEHWLFNFKRHFNIGSRKVTKIVMRIQLEEAVGIEDSAKNFIEKGGFLVSLTDLWRV